MSYLNYLLNGQKEVLKTCITQDVDQADNDFGNAKQSKVDLCIS